MLENTGKKEKILVVNATADGPLARGLEKQGYDVLTCESPQKAWGFVYPTRPHLIILHLEEPTGKDIYALQECRALADGVPVVVATGVSRIAAFTQQLGRGTLRFLSLPLKPNAAREILRSFNGSAGDERPQSQWGKSF